MHEFQFVGEVLVLKFMLIEYQDDLLVFKLKIKHKHIQIEWIWQYITPESVPCIRYKLQGYVLFKLSIWLRGFGSYCNSLHNTALAWKCIIPS